MSTQADTFISFADFNQELCNEVQRLQHSEMAFKVAMQLADAQHATRVAALEERVRLLESALTYAETQRAELAERIGKIKQYVDGEVCIAEMLSGVPALTAAYDER